MTTSHAGACATCPLPPAQAKTARDRFWKRQGIKQTVWVVLPLTLILGWFYPVLGFGVLICMGASIATGFFAGRAWCDVCPRGTFFDVVMRRFSANRPVPKFLRSTAFRIAMLAFLMGTMTWRLIAVWGDLPKMGMVFFTLLAVTTLVGIVLAVPLNARTWCAFCPMGSMAAWIGKRKMPLAVNNEKCTACGLCARACPMELDPAAHRERGLMEHGDCSKCLRCTAVCPKQALSFEK